MSFKVQRNKQGGRAAKFHTSGAAVFAPMAQTNFFSPASRVAVVNSPMLAGKLKRSVYGKDTGKFRLTTTFVYDLNVTTCAESLPFVEAGTTYTPTVVKTDVSVRTPASYTAGYANTGGYHDVRERTPEKMWKLTRVIRTGGEYQYENTLRSMGVRYMWSEEAGSSTDPYRRSFLSFKIDAEGFNCCHSKLFNDNCKQFHQVKQGPTAVTFHFMDPPMGNKAVTRDYQITSGDVATATVETRTVGAWQCIIIPPRKLASVYLPSLHGKANWDKLLEMGFKPMSVGKVQRIFCSNAGIDEDQMEYVIRSTEQPLAQQEENGLLNLEGVVEQSVFKKTELPGKIVKHKYFDTERTCQFYSEFDNLSSDDTARTTSRTRQFWNVMAQGYQAAPFGSAIVFQFCTFHGGNPTNVARLNIPIEIHVDSFTKFKGNAAEQLDLDQLGKNQKITKE